MSGTPFLCSHCSSSFTSAEFDFNASLNDVAPVSLMLFPVDLMKMKQSGLFV